MLILPVIDVMRGQVVRAVGGRRAEYQPLVSQLTKSTEPTAVAAAIGARFGWTQFYIADLDAITGGGEPAYPLYNQFHRTLGFRVWLDSGIQNVHQAARFHRAHVVQLIIGSETLARPQDALAIVEALGAEQLAFSLDLRHGQLMGAGAENWDDPENAAEALIDAGAQRLIVLDLARVGESAGTGTDEFCRRLIRGHPNVAVLAGGGIRGVDDLRRLADIGVSGALVASALHDGRITPEDVRRL
jgi:phosphoribosylformimino-5-aminoimidazole carboxamide ribotide isomerase